MKKEIFMLSLLTTLEAFEAPKIEFSAIHHFGYINSKEISGMDFRRNYLQTKAIFDEKTYAQVTVDATKKLSKEKTDGDIYVKYAYLYLDTIIPYTSVEAGIAHRPWIDYEEHNSWFYRSINKVAIEEKKSFNDSGVNLVGSADLGVNIKTKSNIFNSEIALFSSHYATKETKNRSDGDKLSLEWRLGIHLLENPKKINPLEHHYFNISTFGLLLKHNKKDNPQDENYNRNFYGLHIVYNEPLFLIASQYIKATDIATSNNSWDKRKYDLFSTNFEYRFAKSYSIIARYDKYKKNTLATKDLNYYGDNTLIALSYKYNKFTTFILSTKQIEEKNTPSRYSYMISTELKW